MTHLVDALRILSVHSQVTLAGRWARIEDERCRVHVVDSPWQGSYHGWCDDPAERMVERYANPIEAICDGLRRATIE